MEMREVFTRDGTPTGKIVEKHAQRNADEYLLHTLVILRNREGKYMLQQRSLKARFFAGLWDTTGGGVQADETSRQAAVREVYEELGVTIREEDLRFLFREVNERGKLIVDTYGTLAEEPEGGFRPAETEVNDVKLVSYDEYAEAVLPNRTAAFREALERWEKTCG